MIMKRFQTSARLAIATMAAAVFLVGGLAGVMPPAEAQTAAYPDASNTGVPTGTVLTNQSGTVVISQAGFIYENKNLTGCMVIQANNVIVRKSRINGGSCGYSTISNQGTNTLFEDVEIICNGANGTNGLTFGNYTVRRADISNCENGMWAESNTTLVDSYIHDMIPYNSGDPHTDAVQIGAGQSNITIRHNRIYGGYISQSNFGNSAITTGGNNSNLLIEDNLLAGGGYTMRCEGTGSNTTYRVINNRFSRIFVSTVGGFGPVNLCSQRATQYSGNVYHETGQLLPGQTESIPPQPPTDVRVGS